MYFFEQPYFGKKIIHKSPNPVFVYVRKIQGLLWILFSLLIPIFSNTYYGFERITPHGLRHFYTTYLLVKGVDVKTVSRLLGHSKTATTLDIYAAITKEGYDKAESVLNGELPVNTPDSE